MNFIEYIDKKAMFYDEIDYDIISISWNKIKEFIKLPYVIHIVGTNGKGSTGRFLASFLQQLNKNVLHYSSPHIIEFNERIWINGENSTNEELDKAHLFLQNSLDNNSLDKLTYFEYTTLMALYLSTDMDYIVLEAGLGGEFDATNVIDNNLTLIPSIGIDHTEFLGQTIEEIMGTKMRSCDKNMIVGQSITYNEECFYINSHKISKEMLNLKDTIKIFNSNYFNITLPEIHNQYNHYLEENMKLSLCALMFLNLEYEKINFSYVKLFGRFQKLDENIIIDVGHNELAATAIKKEFKDEKIILVYNSFKNKNYKNVLKELSNTIEELHFLKIDDAKMTQFNDIKSVCVEFNIKIKVFNIDELSANKKYLVFGSFITVENFIKLKGQN